MDNKKKIIFILGTGHCGSTLLDLLLSSHSQAFSLGEVFRVLNADPNIRFCDLCANDCDFWTKDLISKLKNTRHSSLLNKIWKRIYPKKTSESEFYSLFFKETKKNVLVDSSKNPNWIMKNGQRLSKNGKYNLYLIYLSRDGRAVINSLYRKNSQRGIKYFANKWTNNITRVNSCFKNWIYGKKLQIKYKDKAQEPVRTMKEILTQINLEYEPDMMRFWEHSHHSINGNAGTKSLILKFKDKHRHENFDWDKDKTQYYKNLDLGISFDERWKDELEQSQLEEIDNIIHDLNQNII